MIVLKCPNCGEYRTYVRIAIPLSVLIRLHPDGRWRIADEDFELPCDTEFKTEDLDLSNISCYECEHPLELIEIEQCPHKTGADCWDSRYRGMKRHCRLCGEEQQGRIVFEDV